MCMIVVSIPEIAPQYLRPVIERLPLGEYPTSGIRTNLADEIWPGFSAMPDRREGVVECR
jgi:hypothetical protein